MTDTNTTESIHGHEVLHLVNDRATAGSPLTRLTLTREIEIRFGPQPRFHTCSAQGMTLDQLLTFLITRGKIVERDGTLAVDAGEVCGHA